MNVKAVCMYNPSMFSSIGHFTVVGLVSWPLSGYEAEVDLLLIQTFLPFLWKLCLKICTITPLLSPPPPLSNKLPFSEEES